MNVMSRDFTTAEKLLLVLLVLVLVGLGYYYFVDQPVRASIKACVVESEEYENELLVLEQRIEHLKSIQSSMDALVAEGNLTWMGTLRKFLGELGKEYKVADEGADAVIMLTGGGSLMKCVAEEVKKFFPKATIHHDPEAISAIGQGIAYWAPDKIKAILFEKKYREDFLEKNNRNFIAEKFDRAFKECVADIAEALTEEEENALNFGIEQWKTYKCSSYGNQRCGFIFHPVLKKYV